MRVLEKETAASRYAKTSGDELCLTINSYPVTIRFSEKPNHSLAKIIKQSLLASYVENNRDGFPNKEIEPNRQDDFMPNKEPSRMSEKML
jgi:hypothetical protein